MAASGGEKKHADLTGSPKPRFFKSGNTNLVISFPNVHIFMNFHVETCGLHYAVIENY